VAYNLTQSLNNLPRCGKESLQLVPRHYTPAGKQATSVAKGTTDHLEGAARVPCASWLHLSGREINSRLPLRTNYSWPNKHAACRPLASYLFKSSRPLVFAREPETAQSSDIECVRQCRSVSDASYDRHIENKINYTS